jgi:hypothetical protein
MRTSTVSKSGPMLGSSWRWPSRASRPQLRAKGSAGEHTTYIGLQAPADLPEGARVYTPATLHELIPA